MAVWDYFLIRGASRAKFCPHYTHIQAVVNILKVLTTTKAFNQLETELLSACSWLSMAPPSVLRQELPAGQSQKCQKGLVLPSPPTPVGFFVTNGFYFYTCESLCHWSEQSEQSFPLRKHVVGLID